MSKLSTQTRHRAIYNRYCELVQKAQNGGIYHHIYLTSIYLQVAEEMGYSDNYVCRIVSRFAKGLQS